MRIHTIFFGLALSLFSLVATAGSGHSHGPTAAPVSQEQAETIAIESVAALVAKGKIDSSWKSAAVIKTEQKSFGGDNEWVVSFKNEAVSDPTKQTLYIFLTLGGEYIAANYTGN